ncbi:U6 snRNA phosphodiesterase Usb1 [Gautieria morchelliformis]|nr:U6 snRNA phosphodiesterase Usb1 [Gautieria morchelliformis]
MDSLVAYGSSDEDEQPDKESPSPTVDTNFSHPQPKRSLPSLPPTLTPPVPESLPSKHQGRIRTHPHVEGQFASYVYVPVPLEHDAARRIGKVVSHAIKHAKGLVPSINAIIEERATWNSEGNERELHVSLSRPVYLRHHQREDFKKAVRSIASSNAPFPASFATFATFANDEKTRAFLALEVGAGHSEFCKLAEDLTPTLRSLYQSEYYAQPRFHASFAWALLDASPKLQSASCPEVLSDADATISTESGLFPHPSHTIREFPPSLLGSLTDELGEQLRHRGEFGVSEIKVRIGKTVVAYPLCGQ